MPGNATAHTAATLCTNKHIPYASGAATSAPPPSTPPAATIADVVPSRVRRSVRVNDASVSSTRASTRASAAAGMDEWAVTNVDAASTPARALAIVDRKVGRERDAAVSTAGGRGVAPPSAVEVVVVAGEIGASAAVEDGRGGVGPAAAAAAAPVASMASTAPGSKDVMSAKAQEQRDCTVLS